MTDVFDENLIKSIPFQDEKSVRIFNLTALPVFVILLFLHATYLCRYEQVRRDFFTVTTVTACIMSLSCKCTWYINQPIVRILLCMSMLFWFKDMSLRSNFSQYIFFEVPFYFYMVVGYSLNFSWVQLYTYIKHMQDAEIETRLERIKLYLKIILMAAGILLVT